MRVCLYEWSKWQKKTFWWLSIRKKILYGKTLSLCLCHWAEWLRICWRILWNFQWGQTTCTKVYVSNLGYDRDHWISWCDLSNECLIVTESNAVLKLKFRKLHSFCPGLGLGLETWWPRSWSRSRDLKAQVSVLVSRPDGQVSVDYQNKKNYPCWWLPITKQFSVRSDTISLSESVSRLITRPYFVDGFLLNFLWGQTTCINVYVSNLGYDRDQLIPVMWSVCQCQRYVLYIEWPSIAN